MQGINMQMQRIMNKKIKKIITQMMKYQKIYYKSQRLIKINHQIQNQKEEKKIVKGMLKKIIKINKKDKIRRNKQRLILELGRLLNGVRKVPKRMMMMMKKIKKILMNNLKIIINILLQNSRLLEKGQNKN